MMRPESAAHKGEKSMKKKQSGTIQKSKKRISRFFRSILIAVFAFIVGVFARPFLPDIILNDDKHSDTSPESVKFDDIAELAAESVTGRYIYEFTEEKKKFLNIDLPFTGRSALIEYDGTAKAGIKAADQIQISKLNKNEKSVDLDVPEVELLDVYTGNPKIWSTEDNIFNQFRFEEYPAMEDDIKNEFLNNVKGTDLLERAEKSVTNFLDERVKSVFGSDYTVSIHWLKSE